MKIYTYTETARGGDEQLPPLAPGMSSVRFGKDVLLYSEDPQEAKSGARLMRRDEAVTKDRMHIVVQNGRLFQQRHREVPVIHDRGRFLLVDIDARQARKLAKKNETCFGIFPVEENHVVFDSRAPVTRRAPDAFIEKLVKKVSRESIEANLTKLVSFVTR